MSLSWQEALSQEGLLHEVLLQEALLQLLFQISYAVPAAPY